MTVPVPVEPIHDIFMHHNLTAMNSNCSRTFNGSIAMNLIRKVMTWQQDSFDAISWTIPDGQTYYPDIPPSTFIVFAFLAICMVKFLHLFSTPQAPRVTMVEKSKKIDMKRLIDGIPMLQEPYRPPSLWGRSGHLQTATYGILGHASLKRTADERVGVVLSDGSTQTFDIFEPINPHPSGRDLTLALTPGIANCSESNYIRTCVHYAQEHGFRCAVLNHLGALPDVKLTGNRIFSYGGTEELTGMMAELLSRYPSSSFINIGFSMGGNITTKYLIEMPELHRTRTLLGVSICQGYSATISTPMYHDWQNSRRAYNYMITENMKRLLRRNYEQAVEPHVREGTVDEQRLWSCTSIILFDEVYSRRISGHDDLPSFYASVDCLPHLDKLSVPMIFFNAEDDPIIPRELWEPVEKFAAHRDDVAFIRSKHGGHLGFLEGSSFAPRSVTWIDRLIVEIGDQAARVFSD